MDRLFLENMVGVVFVHNAHKVLTNNTGNAPFLIGELLIVTQRSELGLVQRDELIITRFIKN